MGVEYDVLHIVVYFLLYLNCENYMKLLNYYGMKGKKVSLYVIQHQLLYLMRDF